MWVVNMKCSGCNKEKTSIKPSKLTSKELCGMCRIEEWQEMKAESEVDKIIRSSYQ